MPAQTVELEAIPEISATTSDMAKVLAAKSHEKRRQNRLAAANQPSQPQPLQAIPSNSVALEPAQISKELSRARLQLEAAETMLERLLADRECKPADVERAVRSVNGLGERVRILEGRPLPGARRPGPERVRRDAPTAPLD